MQELNKRTFGYGGSAGSENRSPKLGSVRQDRRGVVQKWIALRKSSQPQRATGADAERITAGHHACENAPERTE